MTSSIVSVVSTALSDRLLAGALMLFFGLFLLGGAGFAGSDSIHNAAHDTRHAIGFPCH